MAMPVLLDPNFERTVTLLLEHTEEGALGLVLNRIDHAGGSSYYYYDYRRGYYTDDDAPERVNGTKSRPRALED